MKRELKFRVYDKILGDFLPDFSFSINTTGEILIDDKVIDSQDSYIIQQFTGLKDKNGKEIYEGDILYCLSRSTNRYVVIEYSEYQAAFLVEKNRFIRDFLNFNEVEIIGNIFENSDLIK